MGNIISPNGPLQMTSEKFLVHFKRKFRSNQNMIELENKFLTLKKGNLSVDEYTNSFTDNIEFTLHLVPNELKKSIGTLKDYHRSTLCQLSRLSLLKQPSGL